MGLTKPWVDEINLTTLRLSAGGELGKGEPWEKALEVLLCWKFETHQSRTHSHQDPLSSGETGTASGYVGAETERGFRPVDDASAAGAYRGAVGECMPVARRSLVGIALPSRPKLARTSDLLKMPRAYKGDCASQHRATTLPGGRVRLEVPLTHCRGIGLPMARTNCSPMPVRLSAQVRKRSLQESWSVQRPEDRQHEPREDAIPARNRMACGLKTCGLGNAV
jgi:hypothetical protein